MGCEDLVDEIRRKNKITKENLALEKKTLSKAHEQLSDERDRWAAENQAQEVKNRKNDIIIREKEAQLEALKKKHAELLQRVREVEAENIHMEREHKRLVKQYEEDSRAFFNKKGDLERSLTEATNKMNAVIMSNKWLRFSNENEIRILESDLDSKLRDETQSLRDEFDKQMERYEENYRDLLRDSLYPKQQLLKMLRESYALLKAECEEAEARNKELLQEIELMKNFG